jgi:pilus assembly protein Flp/PilA
MLTFLKIWFAARLPKDEKGQDAAEYALLIALIALAIIVAAGLLGDQIALAFDAVVAQLQTAI